VRAATLRTPAAPSAAACLAALALGCCAALAQADDLAVVSCPVLPADSGLTWTYQGGDDFGVCYAAAAAADTTAIGIYFGNAPTFDPARATPVSPGNVGGRHVVWYRRDAAGGGVLSLQTLVAVNARYVAHVWVTADSEAQLQQRLLILTLVKFRP
jgi:hypothetical protein